MSRGAHSAGNTLTSAAVVLPAAADFTIAGWWWPLANGWLTQFYCGDHATDTEYFRFSVSGIAGGMRVEVKAGGATTSISPAGTQNLAAWNTWAARRVDSTGVVNAWLNGTKDAGATVPTNWPPTMTRSAIGHRYSATPAQYANGYNGPIALWNGTALSDDQIADLFTTQKDFRWLAPTSYWAGLASGNELDLVGSEDFTEAGTVAVQAQDPTLWRRLIRPWTYRGRAA